MSRNEKAVFSFLYFGSVWLWKHVFGWYGWEAFYAVALAFASTMVLGLAYRLAVNTRPRAVPDDLKNLVEAYERAGWRRTRIHPWWQCHGRKVTRFPHVHMMQGGQPLIVASKDVLAAEEIRLPEGS